MSGKIDENGMAERKKVRWPHLPFQGHGGKLFQRCCWVEHLPSWCFFRLQRHRNSRGSKLSNALDFGRSNTFWCPRLSKSARVISYLQKLAVVLLTSKGPTRALMKRRSPRLESLTVPDCPSWMLQGVCVATAPDNGQFAAEQSFRSFAGLSNVSALTFLESEMNLSGMWRSKVSWRQFAGKSLFEVFWKTPFTKDSERL